MWGLDKGNSVMQQVCECAYVYSWQTCDAHKSVERAHFLLMVCKLKDAVLDLHQAGKIDGCVCCWSHTHTHIYIYIAHIHTRTHVYIYSYTPSLSSYTHTNTHTKHTHTKHTHTQNTHAHAYTNTSFSVTFRSDTIAQCICTPIPLVGAWAIGRLMWRTAYLTFSCPQGCTAQCTGSPETWSCLLHLPPSENELTTDTLIT
jgi:hypothetical protein